MRWWTWRVLPAAAWALLTAPGPAAAAQIVQVREYALPTVPPGHPRPPASLTFDRFDPLLGTLTNVEFEFRFEVRSVSVDFENPNPVPVVASVGVQYILNYFGPGLLVGDTVLFDVVDLFEGSVTFGPFDGADFAGPDSFAYRQESPVGDVLTASPVSASAYLGQGTVLVEVDGILGVSVGTTGVPISPRNRVNNIGAVSGVVTLRYDFVPAGTAVPEPGALILAGAGLLATLGLRRRQAGGSTS